jgi:mTERF domain-containing protein
VEELKDLGFNPSKITFGIALEAKLTVNKTLWKEKVDAFKKWGWSDEDVIQAFRRQPHCMLVSVDKINSVLSFWVNQLGWDSLALAIGPSVFSNSLEKRIIPRASVVQFLLKKGLRNKNASLTYPFVVPEKLFLNAFIMRFKEESSYLLKLYEEKLSPAQTSDKIGMS